MHNRYKRLTELCQNPLCTRAEKCWFAHSIPAMKARFLPEEYKTLWCHTAFTGATCSYGDRCHFLHLGEVWFIVGNEFHLYNPFTKIVLVEVGPPAERAARLYNLVVDPPGPLQVHLFVPLLVQQYTCRRAGKGKSRRARAKITQQRSDLTS